MMKDSFPVGTKISSASFIANILLSNDAENAMIAISDISTKSILVGHDDLLYCRRMIQQLTPLCYYGFTFACPLVMTYHVQSPIKLGPLVHKPTVATENRNVTLNYS